jgi:hypothetical protein
VERFDPDAVKESDAQPLAHAIWAATSDAKDDFERCLHGELLIPLGCVPSFQFGGFTQEVSF